jgi:hypothetical protein
MAEEKFSDNLMRVIAAELHLLIGMTAAREMFGKSYFSLGLSEKTAVDQTVFGMIAANPGNNARVSGGPAISASNGLWSPSRLTHEGKLISFYSFLDCISRRPVGALCLEHKSLHGDIGRAPVGLYAALTGRSSQANVCRALARRILIAIEAKHKKSNS